MMQIRRRNLMIAKKQEGLPNEYQEVEYIQSSGTQYTDIELFFNSKTKVEATYFRNSGSGQLTGARTRNNSDVYTIMGAANGKANAAYGTWPTVRTITLTPNMTTGEKHTVIKDGIYNTFDGVVNEAHAEIDFTCKYSAYLFCINDAGSASGLFACRLYKYRVWNDGKTLSRDLVPCYRKSDGEVGLYDLISRQFFKNRGTGVFTAGPAVT